MKRGICLLFFILIFSLQHIVNYKIKDKKDKSNEIQNKDLLNKNIIFLQNFPDLKQLDLLSDKEYAFQQKAKLLSIKFLPFSERRKFQFMSLQDDSSNIRNNKNWRNFVVLLVSQKGEQKMLRTCINKDIKFNFALVLDFNQQCENVINYLEIYKTNEITPKKEEIDYELLI
jgi:hypothetical protein